MNSILDPLDPSQQRLVRLAVGLATELEMASALGWSLSTIRRQKAQAVAATGTDSWRDLVRHAIAESVQPDLNLHPQS